MFPRPQVGIPCLLVYRECECGWWCATGEGDRTPRCPECGGYAVPGGGGMGQFGGEDDHPAIGRQMRGLGFIAVLGHEITLAGVVGKVHRFLLGEWRVHDSRPAPYYTQSEIHGWMRDHGLLEDEEPVV